MSIGESPGATLMVMLSRIFGAVKFSTLLVFAVIIGLFYWGHHYNWQVPGLSSDGGKNGKKQESGRRLTEVESFSLDPKALNLACISLPSHATAAKAGLKIVPVQVRAMTQLVQANGVIEYDKNRYADLSPRASGIAWEVFKKEGDRVRKGEVLAIVAAAEVGRAKSDFLQAIVQVQLRGKIHNALTSLPDIVTLRRLQEAEAAYAEARIQMFNGQQTLWNRGVPVQYQECMKLPDEKAVEKLRFLGLPKEFLDKSNLEFLPANLLPVIAPFDGDIVRRELVIGEYVTPNHPQFVIADLDHLWIQLEVRQEDAALLRLGQEVELTPDSSPGVIARGKINWISPFVDTKTRTVRVRSEVRNESRELLAHTFGAGRIQVQSIPESLAVPQQAIQRFAGRPVLFVQLEEECYAARRVELGIEDGNWVEVRSGLRPGDRVVTNGSHLLESEIVRYQMAHVTAE